MTHPGKGTSCVRLTVTGIVQGVGFRPFLHRLAVQNGICGWVRNTSSGLEGLLSGPQEALTRFLDTLSSSPPPMAAVQSVEVQACAPPPEGLPHEFTILESSLDAGSTLVSPDIAMCADCEAELYTPSDRRYRYPFINCTNCGPRYTIIRALPYDRNRTTMQSFSMCPACAREYRDIRDRRYHAQPDCCPACGPQVFFAGRDGSTVRGDGAFRLAQSLLAGGGILAVKGVGGIHLACDAKNTRAVQRLRRKKRRADKPLAVMCRSLDAVHAICRPDPDEIRLLQSPARPIVLLQKCDRTAFAALSFSARLGVMLPYSPLHTLLIDGAYGGPDTLVMTSGNLSGCPVLTENQAALDALDGVADGFLLHDRPIQNRCDDSLIAVWRGAPYFLRRSRGYAPRPLALEADADGILAMGAEQKASFALGKGQQAFISPYIGDLKNAETFAHYTQAMDTYARLFRAQPSLYVCDLHPDYLSSQEAVRRARAQGVPLLQVQHHWAHMASCMADNGLDAHCFGIIWDGTGLGLDRTIWGGEFLRGDLTHFVRAGSVRAVRLPGGDRAIREIGRIALALVQDAAPARMEAVPLPAPARQRFSRLLCSAPQLCPAASSIGRLFDGVCALLTGRAVTDYEGEGAALLEALSPVETPEALGVPCAALAYPLTFYPQEAVRVFDTRPLIAAILDDLAAGQDSGRIALRFLATLCCLALDQCQTLNPDRLPVVLSGGVFQNRFLLAGVTALLEQNGFSVYTHHRVSTNDEGLCLGQLAIARKKRSMNHVPSNAYADL